MQIHTGGDARLAPVTPMVTVYQAHLPELPAGALIGTKGVQAVVRGCHEDDVSPLAGHLQVGGPQRLRVDRTVYRTGKELAEARGIHVGGGESVLVRVRAIAREIIVIGVDTGKVGDTNSNGAAVRRGGGPWRIGKRRGGDRVDAGP